MNHILQHALHYRGGSIELSPPFRIAGIINVTPDSFSDGGKCYTPADALLQAQNHIHHGADFLDIGAESTRPGATDIGSQEEIRRLTPVLQAVLPLAASTPTPLCVSIDTFRAKTAATALEMGAHVINDVSGGCFEPAILDVVAEHKAGYILGHSNHKPQTMQNNPYYDDIISHLMHHFTKQLNLLVKKGVPESNICLDPCIGFGKNIAHTQRIFTEISTLQSLGRPLYFGISNKSFMGTITNFPVEKRLCQTQVATVLLALQGVLIHRVHDVEQAHATRLMLQALHSQYMPTS